MMNQVNTAVSETDCSYMNGWTPEQILSAVGVALAEMDEQVNVIVSGLSRLPEIEWDRIAGDVLSGMDQCLERVQDAVSVSR